MALDDLDNSKCNQDLVLIIFIFNDSLAVISLDDLDNTGFNFDYLHRQRLTCCDDRVGIFRFYAEPILHNKRVLQKI